MVAFAALCTATASAGQPAAFDWETAVAAFAAGEQASPRVFTIKNASRCSGRWKLHADALGDDAFPDGAYEAFTPQLRLPDALDAIDFYLVDDKDPPAARVAADEAERVLARALTGDAAAAYIYFKNLGLCSTHSEMVKDSSGVAEETPAMTGQ